jgi:hypothetical protein
VCTYNKGRQFERVKLNPELTIKKSSFQQNEEYLHQQIGLKLMKGNNEVPLSKHSFFGAENWTLQR